MHDQAFAILEFNSLRALVSRNAQTDMGRARVDAVSPVDDFPALQRELDATGECIELRKRGVRFSFESVTDPAEPLSRLRIEGAALEALALLDLARICERALDVRAAIQAEGDACPSLFAIVAALPRELNDLKTFIARKILPNGELDDRASPELARIRRELTRLRANITRSLEGLMRRSADAIQDELVTVRNDRFVIPVRADHRGAIKGVAHGISSSGATIFIEPLESIDANNELQNLREDEEREIANVLFELSERLRQQLPGLELAASAIAELDFINAKAIFAEKFSCVVPQIGGAKPRLVGEASGHSDRAGVASNAGTLELIDARHPLLEQNLRASSASVVPVSFKLDEENSTMVISGANAGGKTVVLKTAGLLSLMALSGLPVPAHAARVPFCKSILADIGDHQSLAANLSTFTSHVANIASMIDRFETPGLVLLDEVGTGTDPEEGSALGVAVVDHFKQRGAHVLATTHYSGLKMYAANQPGVSNASVEFDEKTLRPTYRLLVGLAGSSSGLEIAQRFGIPSEVISSAITQVRESSRQTTEYLRRIKREAEEAESLRSALEEERMAVAERFASLDKQFQKREAARQIEFEESLARMLSEFDKRGREIVLKIEERAERAKVEREAQKRAAELKREAQKAAQDVRNAGQGTSRMGGTSRDSPTHGREGGLPPPLRGVRVIRDGKVFESSAGQTATGQPPEVFDELTPETSRGPDVRGLSPADELHVGDRVRLTTLGSIGVVDRIKGDEAEVRVGSLHVREKLSNLELLTDMRIPPMDRAQNARDTKGRAKASLENLRRQSATTELHLHSSDNRTLGSISKEINLLGKKTDEAVELVDKFLDEAFLNGLSEVRIIHGHGTGALRKAVADFLADHPHVARFAPASPDQGGSGATLVTLEQ